jgi:NADH dehydrogenase
VVIVGGGFGGLYAARSLRRADVEVILIDRQNHHLFQPLLYQVATGGLSPANIAAPLRALLSRQANASVLLGEVFDIDVALRRVILADGEVPYDSLIVATGSTHSYFGHTEWEPYAPGLKTIEDATQIRSRILFAFERAERETDPAETVAWQTFVIVGGGPTGVELAGSVAEIAHSTLKHDFRRIDPSQSRILLVEGLGRVLPPYPEQLSNKAAEGLADLGVETRTGAQVIDITPNFVTLQKGEQTEQIRTHCVLWAAGVQASPLGHVLARETGAELDRSGRVHVLPDLSVKGHPEVFVIGDLAFLLDANGKPLPGLAPVAMQEGAYVARLITRRLKGKSVGPFRYRDHGSMATIGRGKAVVDLRGLRFDGVLAWLVWLFVHLMYLVQFENRVLVLLQWAWHYVTRNRSARLITGEIRNTLPARTRPAEQVSFAGDSRSEPNAPVVAAATTPSSQ